AELLSADFGEDFVAVSEQSGNGRNGIPEDVAESAQPGKIFANAVPVGGVRVAGGRAELEKPARILSNFAAVQHFKRERSSGRERRGKLDIRFVKQAGVVGVAIQGLLRELQALAVRAGSVEFKRRGKLDGQHGKRLRAVVANHKLRPGGKRMVTEREVKVEVVGREKYGGAFSVGDFGSGVCSGFCSILRWSGRGLILRPRKEDRGVGGLWRGFLLGERGERGAAEKGCGEKLQSHSGTQ